MKKQVASVCMCVIIIALLMSCSHVENTKIYVISREEGSGTRSSFSELFGVVDENGTDAIFGGAEKVTSTATVISTVVGVRNAIGYISISALNDSIKGLNIDNVSPTVENIRDGKYKLSRPFNLCFREGEISAVANDFLEFIMSMQGEKIISESGYIPTNSEGGDYVPRGYEGKITISGSSSVSPLIEKLRDLYRQVNPNVEIEVQQTGSGAGIQSASVGVCDIGMSSRNLEESELEYLKSIKIADDGIVVIVNKENPINNISSPNVKNIYLGITDDWAEVMD